MPIIADSIRKNAFSQRLKDKRQKAVAEAEMSEAQMKTFQKGFSDARRWIGNLHCMISEPSLAQAKEINSQLDELVADIQRMKV